MDRRYWKLPEYTFQQSWYNDRTIFHLIAEIQAAIPRLPNRGCHRVTRLSQFSLVCILSIWFVPFIVQSPWWQKTIHSLSSTRFFLVIFVPCEFCSGYQECYHSQWSWFTMPHLCGLGIDRLYQIIGKLIQCTEWKIWVQSNTKQQNSFYPQSYLVAYIQGATIKYPVMYISSYIFIYVYMKLLMFYV